MIILYALIGVCATVGALYMGYWLAIKLYKHCNSFRRWVNATPDDEDDIAITDTDS